MVALFGLLENRRGDPAGARCELGTGADSVYHYHKLMLGSAAILIALLALAIVLGGVPLPLGIWPGISLGLLAAVAAVLELRQRPGSRRRKVLAGLALALGAGAALLGIAVYVGLMVVTG